MEQAKASETFTRVYPVREWQGQSSEHGHLWNYAFEISIKVKWIENLIVIGNRLCWKQYVNILVHKPKKFYIK